MKDIICWVVIGIVIMILTILTWTLCVMASRSDYIAERDWIEYLKRENNRMQKKAQNAYEKYRERFANDYHLTLEEATEYQAVKNYKEYLEEQCKEYGVKICEKVGD